MTFISWAVLTYILIQIPIGLYAARKVRTTEDYVLAGRGLPFHMALATVFATWFGSESVLGASSKFADGGLKAVVADPFGASLCLILAGLFFNKKLYKLSHLTIGDYFSDRYNVSISFFLSTVIVISYFSWVAAQFLAIGLVLHTLFPVSLSLAIIAAAIVVMLYTMLGGMVSVALHDTIQSVVVIIGLLIAFISVLPLVGGFESLIASTPKDYWNPLPSENSFTAWSIFCVALMTQGFGSIPQQDVYQRAMSAKSANQSMWASILGGWLYFVIIFIPMLLTLIAKKVYIDHNFSDSKSQLLLPTLITEHTSPFVQIIFFGALVSAILSASSGALIAPSTLIAENILKPFTKKFSDRLRMRTIQASIAFVGTLAIFFALGKNAHIYDLVEHAYTIPLVAAFIPLVFGLYTKWVNSFAVLISMIFGIFTWQYFSFFPLQKIPPQFLGFIASLVGILLGGFVYKLYIIKNKRNKITVTNC